MEIESGIGLETELDTKFRRGKRTVLESNWARLGSLEGAGGLGAMVFL